MLEGSFSHALRFRAFGIPVRVEATFLVATALLAWHRLASPESFATWLVVVFVSIFVHELGHAFMGRRFGLTPSIRIYGWGGLTSWTAGPALSPGRKLAVALAGPVVDIALGVACWFALAALPDASPRTVAILGDFVWAAGFWGAVNLVPLLPLDGGHALEAVLEKITPARAAQATRAVSALAGALVGALALYAGYSVPALVAVWLGFDSARGFVIAWRETRDQALIDRYQPQLRAALEVQDAERMIALATEALREARGARARAWLVENLVVAHALLGAIDAAVDALDGAPDELPAGTVFEALVVRVAVAARRRAAAISFGETPDATIVGPPQHEGEGEGEGDVWREACEALRGPLDAELDAVAFAHVREAADVLRRDRDAGPLGERLFERDRDPDLAFALACVWARAGDEARALRFAEEAVALGFRDHERAASTPALALAAGRRAAAALDAPG